MIETQKAYRITASNLGQRLPAPASYIDGEHELVVFMALEGEAVGTPINAEYYESDHTVLPAQSVLNSVIVVRVIPTLELLFTKQARTSLSASEVNALYQQMLIAISSTQDRILTEYGIIVTGDLDLSDMATQTNLDLAVADITTNTSDLASLQTQVDAIVGAGTEAVACSLAEAEAGTEAGKFISPLTATHTHKYLETKFLHTVLFDTEEQIPADAGEQELHRLRVPKMLDGLFAKEIEVQVSTNNSSSVVTLKVEQHDGIGGELSIATANIAQGQTFADKVSGGVFVEALDSTQDLVFILENTGVVKGLTISVTFGHASSVLD